MKNNKFENGEIVWDMNNNTYGIVLNNYSPEDFGEVRLDSDGNQPISDLRKLGDKEDVGTKEQLIAALLAHKNLITKYPENGYERVYY